MAGPLEGVKVLDLTRVLAGPYATMVLADLGAEVIKVERPEGGDMARGDRSLRQWPRGSYFMSINRGKKSVILDLKDEAGKETFLEILGAFRCLGGELRAGCDETAGAGLRCAPGEASGPDLRCGLGFRAVGALHEASGPRHNRAGHGEACSASPGSLGVRQSDPALPWVISQPAYSRLSASCLPFTKGSAAAWGQDDRRIDAGLPAGRARERFCSVFCDR